MVGELTGSDLLLALAYFGFFINLFNLLPVVPLDGGRAMAAMSPWMWFVGLGVLVALVFLEPGNPILLIIVLFGGDADLPPLAAAQNALAAAGGLLPRGASPPAAGGARVHRPDRGCWCSG